MNTKEILKEFLRTNQYYVMHESDIDNPNIEHFFVFFQKKDIFKITPTKYRDFKEAKIILAYLNEFQQITTIQNISDSTLTFIKNKRDKLIYIPLLSLNKNHHLYTKKKKELEDNYENFLCIRMIGEPADPFKYFNYIVNSKISDIKNISLGITSFAKEIVQEKLSILKKKP
jgi:hypothetical protein